MCGCDGECGFGGEGFCVVAMKGFAVVLVVSGIGLGVSVKTCEDLGVGVVRAMAATRGWYIYAQKRFRWSNDCSRVGAEL